MGSGKAESAVGRKAVVWDGLIDLVGYVLPPARCLPWVLWWLRVREIRVAQHLNPTASPHPRAPPPPWGCVLPSSASQRCGVILLKSYFLCEKENILFLFWGVGFKPSPALCPIAKGSPSLCQGRTLRAMGTRCTGTVRSCLVPLRADGREITPPQHADKYGL